ncbi:MAG: CdaR family protein [Armatimonadota bacterium]
MNTLRRNFGYKFISLLVSILLYWIASGQKNNPDVRTDIFVQPAVEGLPDNLILKSAPQGSAVSVSGTAQAVEAFRSLEPKAILNLSSGKVGSDRYPVKYLYPNGFSDTLEIIGPPVALVTLEQKKSVKFTVDVLYNDNPPAGYAYSDARSAPATVQVVGLYSDVIRVQRVVANLDTSGAPGAISQDVELVAQDVKQEPVENVQIVPKQVRASLGLKKTPSTKTVLLSIELIGNPAPGYEISGYDFFPNVVTVSGSQELLASRSSLRVPVDVDGLKAGTNKTVIIQPPSGLRVVGGDAAVRLRLNVRPVATASPAPSATPALPSPTPTTPSASTSPAASTP